MAKDSRPLFGIDSPKSGCRTPMGFDFIKCKPVPLTDPSRGLYVFTGKCPPGPSTAMTPLAKPELRPLYRFKSCLQSPPNILPCPDPCTTTSTTTTSTTTPGPSGCVCVGDDGRLYPYHGSVFPFAGPIMASVTFTLPTADQIYPSGTPPGSCLSGGSIFPWGGTQTFSLPLNESGGFWTGGIGGNVLFAGPDIYGDSWFAAINVFMGCNGSSLKPAGVSFVWNYNLMCGVSVGWGGSLSQLSCPPFSAAGNLPATVLSGLSLSSASVTVM